MKMDVCPFSLSPAGMGFSQSLGCATEIQVHSRDACTPLKATQQLPSIFCKYLDKIFPKISTTSTFTSMQLRTE